MANDMKKKLFDEQGSTSQDVCYTNYSAELKWEMDRKTCNNR